MNNIVSSETLKHIQKTYIFYLHSTLLYINNIIYKQVKYFTSKLFNL